MSAHSNITKEKYPFIKMRIIEIAWKPILRAFCPMVSWGSNLLSPPPIPFLNPALGQGMWKPTLLLLSTISLMFSHQIVSNSLWPHGLQPIRLLCPWDFPGKNTGVDSYFLLQGIFLTQGSNLLSCTGFFTTVEPGKQLLLNPALPHGRQILYPLSHQGSPINTIWCCLILYDLAVPCLGIYLEKTVIQKDKCTPMFTALITITKMWKQPKRPATEKWIRKMWYIYTMEYHSIRKKEGNTATCSNMDGPRDDHTKWRKSKKKDKYHMISLICGV